MATKPTRAQHPDKAPRAGRLDRLGDKRRIESLTMHKLAQKLGLKAVSLHHQAVKKSDLLDGRVDLVFSGINLPMVETGWKARWSQRARGPVPP